MFLHYSKYKMSNLGNELIKVCLLGAHPLMISLELSKYTADITVKVQNKLNSLMALMIILDHGSESLIQLYIKSLISPQLTKLI